MKIYMEKDEKMLGQQLVRFIFVDNTGNRFVYHLIWSKGFPKLPKSAVELHIERDSKPEAGKNEIWFLRHEGSCITVAGRYPELGRRFPITSKQHINETITQDLFFIFARKENEYCENIRLTYIV